MTTVQLHLGDCLEFMRALPAGSVDAVITDPPYSKHVHNNARRGTRDSHGNIYGDVKDFGFSHLTDDTMQSASKSITQIVKRWVLVFSDIESAPLWRQALSGELDYIRTGAWVKIAPMPQFTGDRPAAGFEAVTIMHPKGRKRWNGGGKAAVWRYCAHGGARDVRYHKAQKPLELIEELVKQFTDEGDTIFDPFMGSDTTGVAAVKLGRNFIGCEIEPKYYEIAQRRIADAQAQMVMPL